MQMDRCYSELCKLSTFKERFNYLKLSGVVGEETFGWDRYVNQILYKSYKWRRTRDRIIVRDSGCDLGLEGYDICGKVIVHHINPITIEDVMYDRDCVYDPENLISTTLLTHNAIHYGDESLLVSDPVERTINDTCPWRHK